jgi:hypothetical protein
MKPADCAGERSSGGSLWMLALRECEVDDRPQDREHGSDGMNRGGALPVALRAMIAVTSMLMCQRGISGTELFHRYRNRAGRHPFRN